MIVMLMTEQHTVFTIITKPGLQKCHNATISKGLNQLISNSQNVVTYLTSGQIDIDILFMIFTQKYGLFLKKKKKKYALS